MPGLTATLDLRGPDTPRMTTEVSEESAGHHWQRGESGVDCTATAVEARIMRTVKGELARMREEVLDELKQMLSETWQTAGHRLESNLDEQAAESMIGASVKLEICSLQQVLHRQDARMEELETALKDLQDRPRLGDNSQIGHELSGIRSKLEEVRGGLLSRRRLASDSSGNAQVSQKAGTLGIPLDEGLASGCREAHAMAPLMAATPQQPSHRVLPPQAQQASAHITMSRSRMYAPPSGQSSPPSGMYIAPRTGSITLPVAYPTSPGCQVAVAGHSVQTDRPRTPIHVNVPGQAVAANRVAVVYQTAPSPSHAAAAGNGVQLQVTRTQSAVQIGTTHGLAACDGAGTPVCPPVVYRTMQASASAAVLQTARDSAVSQDAGANGMPNGGLG